VSRHRVISIATITVMTTLMSRTVPRTIMITITAIRTMTLMGTIIMGMAATATITPPPTSA